MKLHTSSCRRIRRLARMPTLPEYVAVITFANGERLPGAWVMVSLGVVSKNPYHLVFGPTSAAGTLMLDRKMIVEAAAAQQYLAIMDYAPLEGGWDGVIQLDVMDGSDVARAMSGYALWGEVRSFPSNYVEGVRAFGAALTTLGNVRLSIQVSLLGGEGVRVVTLPRTANSTRQNRRAAT